MADGSPDSDKDGHAHAGRLRDQEAHEDALAHRSRDVDQDAYADAHADAYTNAD